jgi:hypothetical protein
VGRHLGAAGDVRATNQRWRPRGDPHIKASTDDRAKSRLHELKGTLVENAGGLTGDPEWEAEGKQERTPAKCSR